MDNGTKKTVLPSLIESVVNDPSACVDNIFAGLWKSMKLKRIWKSGLRYCGVLPGSGLRYCVLINRTWTMYGNTGCGGSASV